MPSSIDHSARSSLRRVTFAILAVAAVAFAGWALAAQLREFRDSSVRLQPRWSLIVASSGLVLFAHLVLIETWRRVVAAWDAELSFAAAMRIWCVSNLGRYVPGKVWAIAAMGAMARARGVSAVAAAGSSLVINIVNIIVGTGVAAVMGAEFLGERAASFALSGGLLLALIALPALIPYAVRLVNRVTGRGYSVPDLPRSAFWISAIGCALAWMLYGVAFQIFVFAVLGEAPGSTASYVAAYTASYVLGYIALFAPGGIGVREGMLIEALRRLPFATAGGPGIVALSSRLWLSVLEIMPGLFFLAYDTWRGRPSTIHDRTSGS
jgi:glycosyltransferase 2 family protein